MKLWSLSAPKATVFSCCNVIYGFTLILLYAFISRGRHYLLEYPAPHHNNLALDASHSSPHTAPSTTLRGTTTKAPPGPWKVQNLPPSLDCLFAKMPMAGRLGNELFLYATLFALGVRYNRTVLYQAHSILFKMFNITAMPIVYAHPGWITKREKYANTFDGSIARFVEQSHGRVQLVGYFQSYKYFDKFKDALRKELGFSSEIKAEVDGFLHKSVTSAFGPDHKDDVVYVGVHIRRGDMTTTYGHKRGYTEASPEYLNNAVKYFHQIINPNNTLFVVVSDDMGWSKDHFNPQGSKVVYSAYGKNASVDLGLLAACNHTIMTVGSFGWWGAYLAGGTTVYYKDFPLPGTYISRLFTKNDYFASSWVGLR